MSSKLRRQLAIGGAVLAAAAVGGGAYAATQSNTNPRQAFLNDVAKRLKVSPQQLNSAISSARLDQLNAAVKAGRLTQAQANAIKRQMQAHGGAPFFGPGRFGLHRGFGPPVPGGPMPGGPMLAGPLGGASSYLGLTPPQLFKQLVAGKSLAQVAQAQHKSVSGLEKAMEATVKARLDKAVKAKIITSAQEQKVLSRIPALINRKVNRAGYGPRFFFRSFHGRGGAVRPGLAVPPAGAPGTPPAGPASLPAGPPPVTY